MPRVALIHALTQSISPINDELSRAWPECERMNVLDDSLSSDVARAGHGLDATFDARFVRLAEYAASTGADGILFTCSAFGRCIDAAALAAAPLPVLKPNEAMIAEAISLGRRVGLVATFGPTLASMPAEFPASVELRTALATGALEALRRDDAATHDARVVATARELADAGCEVIALAQFTMARAAAAVESSLGLPVLTTVGSAVRALRGRIGGGT